jgi:(2Fe-2S) ferredoxin
MQKPEHHFLVCASFRVGGEPLGICANKGSADLLWYLENEIIDRGLDAVVSSTGCLKVCEKGPVLVHYPAGNWYGGMTKANIDLLLDAVEEGKSPDLPEL